MPDDARFRVAVDVGLPLPAGRVRVARADVLGLQALEFLLGAELVGLGARARERERELEMTIGFSGIYKGSEYWRGRGRTYHDGWVALRSVVEGERSGSLLPLCEMRLGCPGVRRG